MNRRFSISSLILGYFLIAGGLVLGLIALVFLKSKSESVTYLSFALGGAIGGFVASRASAGMTIREPAIASVLVVASIVGFLAATPQAGWVWHVASDKVGRAILMIGVSTLVGSVAGAALSEKVFGKHWDSLPAWLLYVAMSTMGANFIAIFAMIVLIARGAPTDAQMGGAFLGAVGLGCLISGLATGAAASRRLLLMNLVGAVVGEMGFFFMMNSVASGKKSTDDKVVAGFLMIGVLGGLAALIGNAIGWKLFGVRAVQKRQMEATARAFD